MRKLLGFAAFAYVAMGLLLWFGQRSILYPAPRVARADLDREAKRFGAKVLDLTAADGTRLYGWHRPAEGERAVIFFPGNGETVARVDLHQYLVGLGWDVVAIAYRGYPGSDGKPSESGLYEDARAAWAYVTEQLGIAPGKIVLHGKSLGGGIASKLAEEVAPGGLVLESTFLSVPKVAAGAFPFFPARWLVRDRFDTESRASAIHAPTLIVHGDGDGVIPVWHGRELGKRFEGATYVEVANPEHGESLTVHEPAARDAYLALLTRVATAPAVP